MSSEHSFDEKTLVEQTLRQVLPGTVTLVVNSPQRVLVVLSGQEHTLARFTPSEWNVLLALAEAYPHYSPFEALMARLMDGPADYYRERWHQAQQQGRLREELRPIREAITGLRAKLRPFLLTIAFIPETGYLLATVSSPTPPA
jgi:hypothetical protein